MSDGTQGSDTGSAAAPATAAPQAPTASPTVPDGMELVPSSEIRQLRDGKRQADTYRGYTPLVEPLIHAGIKTREDLEAVLNPVRQARELGVDLNGVLTSLRRPDAAQQEADEKPLTRAELMAALNERESTARHKAAETAENQMVRGLLDELVGANGTAEDREVAEGLVWNHLSRQTAVYDSGPLKGQVRPLTDTEFARIRESTTSKWRAFRGQHLQSIAANAGTARTAPGTPGGMGVAATSATSAEPGTPEHRAQAIARLEQLQMRRSGAPLSQA